MIVSRPQIETFTSAQDAVETSRRDVSTEYGPAYLFSHLALRISAASSLISVKSLCISLHPYQRA